VQERAGDGTGVELERGDGLRRVQRVRDDGVAAAPELPIVAGDRELEGVLHQRHALRREILGDALE